MLEALEAFISNPVVTGCLMLVMNIGGKYVMLEVPKGMEVFFTQPWVRKFIVFCIAFMATRNLKSAFLIFLLFVLFSRYLLNENSNNCLRSVKERVKEIEEKDREKK